MITVAAGVTIGLFVSQVIGPFSRRHGYSVKANASDKSTSLALARMLRILLSKLYTKSRFMVRWKYNTTGSTCLHSMYKYISMGSVASDYSNQIIQSVI